LVEIELFEFIKSQLSWDHITIDFQKPTSPVKLFTLGKNAPDLFKKMSHLNPLDHFGVTKNNVEGFLQGAHPYPNSQSFKNGEDFIKWLGEFESHELLYAGISGGGSALLEYPKEPFSFEDVIKIHKVLVESGLDIREVNKIRALCSNLKAGQCLRYFTGKAVYQYIASDIPMGDDFWTSSSLFLNPKIKVSRKIIEKTFKGSIREKLLNASIEDNQIKTHTNIIINQEKLIKVATEFFANKSLKIVNISNSFDQNIDTHLKLLLEKDIDVICSFNELNIPLIGPVGLGGRNSHFVLLMAKSIFEDNLLNLTTSELEKISFGSIATDGEDGNSPYAGAYFNYKLYKKSLEMKLEINQYLIDFNSAKYFEELNCLYNFESQMNLMDFRFIIKN